MSAWSHVGSTCTPSAETPGHWEWTAPEGWTPQRRAWLTRRWGWLSEHCALVPRIESSSAQALLVLAGPAGAAYAASPEGLARLSPLLGQLDRALRACDLQLSLSPNDLWLDADGQPWLFGLAGLRRALGAPGVAHVADTLRTLGGADPGQDFAAVLRGWRKDVFPQTLATWRAAVHAESLVGLAAADAPSWNHVRSEPVLHCFPESAQGLIVFAGAAPREPDADPRTSRWWALEPSTDRLRILVQPSHDDSNLAQVSARRTAFRAEHVGATTGPPLHAQLAKSPAPALRSGEPFVLAPPPSLPRPGAPPAPPAPPRLRVAADASGEGVELFLDDLPEQTTAVVFVRCGAADPLIPADGEVLAEVPVGGLPCADANAAERYAAFALCDGSLTPPAFAAYWGGPEVEQLELEPGIGSVTLRWEAPPQALIEVHANGKLSHSAQGAGEWVHDCLDAGQRIDYSARVSLSDGSYSPGVADSAVALGPPPALGDVSAEGGDHRVALSWSWPPQAGYQLVEVERVPAFEEGLRKVRRGAESELVDLDVDPGVEYRYVLRTAFGDMSSVHSSEATATPSAELEGVVAEPAGEAVWLRWVLPAGVDPNAAEVVLVRNLERPPQDLADGERLQVSGTEHLDRPLPVGTLAHYRAALRLGATTSPGLLGQATARASAGAMGPLEVEAGQGTLELTFTPPAERCEEVQVFVGPADGPLERVEAPAFAGPSPVTLEVKARPGVSTRLRLVPCHDGYPDQGQAIETTATAWDDLSELTAPARAGTVELRWTPPASAPSGYTVQRTQLGRKGEPQEWTLPGDAEHFVDDSAQPRLKYSYEVACLWSGVPAAQAPHTIEVTALGEPPELPKAELRVEPGHITLRYLPVPSSARLRFSGAAIYSSADSVAELEAKFAEHPTFDRDRAEALGLVEVALRQRSKRKEIVRCDPPPPGTLATYVLASLNQHLARPVLVAAGLGLSEQFATISAHSEPAGIRLNWSWPDWLTAGDAQITKLVLERGLDEVPDSLTGDDLDLLSAPWSEELPTNTMEFEDREALGFLAWGYRLSVSLTLEGHSFTLDGPRLVVPPTPGGTLRLTANQPRGLFGAKDRVDLEVNCPAPRWPEFDIVRVVGNQQAGKSVAHFPGGTPSPAFVDEDLGNFGSGTRLRYLLKLKQERDKLGFEVSESEVQLG